MIVHCTQCTLNDTLEVLDRGRVIALHAEDYAALEHGALCCTLEVEPLREEGPVGEGGNGQTV
jgi:hypothetical protein